MFTDGNDKNVTMIDICCRLGIVFFFFGNTLVTLYMKYNVQFMFRNQRAILKNENAAYIRIRVRHASMCKHVVIIKHSHRMIKFVVIHHRWSGGVCRTIGPFESII